MNESPVQPRRPMRGTWIVLSFLVGAALAVSVMLLVDRPVAPQSPSAAVASTAVGDAATPTPFNATPSHVDALIAADGTPFDLSAADADYADAYARIKDDCDTMADVTITPQQWLAAHLVNASVPGEAAALKIGIPLVCPQYNSALLATEGG